jgi:hypothetical protein
MRDPYPIRFTRRRWNIPLFCTHKCDENCNILIVTNNNNEYILIENPEYSDGKCNFYNILSDTYIKISSFDINTPMGNSGPLYNADTKVITDNSFVLSIYFPLSNVFEIVISSQSPDSDGFTLKELLYSLRNLYELIYEGENETSTPQVYDLKKICTSCGNKDLTKYVLDVSTSDILEECSICYDNFKENKDPLKLKCNHIYHKSCIKTWLEQNGTCPICRNNVFECLNCNGSGIIYYNFIGNVIPLEHRGLLLNRNQSNGIFGIYNWDLEDLIIDKLSYDRKKKRLHMSVTA